MLRSIISRPIQLGQVSSHILSFKQTEIANIQQPSQNFKQGEPRYGSEHYWSDQWSVSQSSLFICRQEGER